MKYTLFYLFISLSNTVIGQTESSNFHGFKGEGNFIDGKQNGLWKYYYTNGQLYSEGNFKDDNKIGCWKYYDGNEKPYIEGRLFDKNEEIIMPESEAKEQGLEYKIITFEEYDDNGDRTQEAQVRVEKHREADSLWQFYNEYDAVYGEIEWKNGKQDSRWVSDGLLGDQYWFKGEGNFIGGKKNGLWEYFELYHPQKELYLSGHYKNGKWDGQWKYGTDNIGYYKDGQWISGVDIRELCIFGIPGN